MDNQQQALRLSYDDLADVLYVTVRQGAPSSYREDEGGLVWRFDERGQPVGVTVLSFHELWQGRVDALMRIIVKTLSLRVSERGDVVQRMLA